MQTSNPENHKPSRGNLNKLLNLLVVINFVLFLLISTIAGGTSANGKIVNNDYFIGSHGEFTKVTCLFYYYNYIHMGIVLLLFLVWIIFNFKTITLTDSPTNNGTSDAKKKE